MKAKDSSRIGPLLEKFFIEFLCGQKRVSNETIASYRDTFRLLLCYIREKHKIAPEALRVSDLDVGMILSFLQHLEDVRHNSIKSRNLRLSAIRSFFRIVALSDPKDVEHSSRVLAIPVKRTDSRLISSISRNEMESILAAPDLNTCSGRRDHALLLTMYNTGMRVSEVIALDRSQVLFGSSAFIRINGKGRKERTVPVWSKTAQILQALFAEQSRGQSELAFPNRNGGQLTRNGVNYILQKAVRRAADQCSSLQKRTVTPHTVRHSTASHLLQSGVDISIIALWLGHESIETTHRYIEADLATKERALSKLAPAGSDVPPLKIPDSVLAFLAKL